MLEKKRVFIVVKTYPTISEKYAELVCTAGILEDGSWIRLYPIPFRKLDDFQKYPKYSWIQVNAERNAYDFRPETYRPDLSSIHIESTYIKRQKVDWDERRRIIFKNKTAITNLQELIEKAKSDGTSLAVFKPSKIHDFISEASDRDWNAKKLESLRNLSMQMNLFQTVEEIEAEYKVVPKVPYKFSYTFEDDSGRQSTMMIEDWEIGMLYFNCLKRADGNENAAIANVRKKYFDEFLTKDLYFFMGTTKQFHNIAPNPFIIVGVFYPPMQSSNQQMGLLDFNGQKV